MFIFKIDLEPTNSKTTILEFPVISKSKPLCLDLPFNHFLLAAIGCFETRFGFP